uniref:receptor protein-tyrosine kinase n=1 Tax=Scylla olivacea TaxID=85551 RepID=A0A0P4WGM4_SCYOL
MSFTTYRNFLLALLFLLPRIDPSVTCSSSSHDIPKLSTSPVPVMYWFYYEYGGLLFHLASQDGEKPVRQLGDVKIKGAMLKMENLVPADSGNYTCVVFNECGAINHTYGLEVLERLPSRPIINKELSNMTVVQGSEVKLMCSVISDLVPYITWVKHPTRYNGVDDKGNIINRLFIVKEGRNITSSEDPQVLILSNVTERDAGWYTCIAANSLGTSFSTAYLSVIDAEPVMHDPEYHAIMVLTVVLLSVMVIGSIVASFVWKKWQKEKRRAIELERAKAITQHWIKKVIGGYYFFTFMSKKIYAVTE